MPGLQLFSNAIVAIDGSKFKAVNNRDKNLTERKLQARKEQLESSAQRYLEELDRTDRTSSATAEARSLKSRMRRSTVEHPWVR
jgi:hypothetical protein